MSLESKSQDGAEQKGLVSENAWQSRSGQTTRSLVFSMRTVHFCTNPEL